MIWTKSPIFHFEFTVLLKAASKPRKREKIGRGQQQKEDKQVNGKKDWLSF